MNMTLTKDDLLDLESLLTPERTAELLSQDTELQEPTTEARSSLNKAGASIASAATAAAGIMQDQRQKGAVRLAAVKLVMQVHGVVADDNTRREPTFNTIVFNGDQTKAMAVLNPRRG